MKSHQSHTYKTDLGTPQYKRLGLRVNGEDVKIMHYLLGMSSEVGEVSDLFKKTIMRGEKIAAAQVVEEVGDLLWYVDRLLANFNSSIPEAFEANKRKLELRYPDGFSVKDSKEKRDEK